MKRIVNGVTYNTDTSTALARSEWQPNDGEKAEGCLYQTRGGAFFVHTIIAAEWFDDEDREWRTKTTNAFEPMTAEEAHRWIMEGDVEIHHNPFDDPPEATAETDPGATIYVRVPATLKRQIDAAAKGASQSVNTWAMRCLEQCIASKSEAI